MTVCDWCECLFDGLTGLCRDCERERESYFEDTELEDAVNYFMSEDNQTALSSGAGGEGV